MSVLPPELRVIVEREGEMFVAQGVDYDISAEGASPKAALDAFAKTLVRYILVARHLGAADALEHVPAPPPAYAKMWDEILASGAEPEPFRFPRFLIRRRSGEASDTVENLSGRVLVA